MNADMSVKCAHTAVRVPRCPTTSRRPAETGVFTRERSIAGAGWSATHHHTTNARATLSTAVPRKVGVQPYARRAADSGTVPPTWPSDPVIAVSAVSTANRRRGNQEAARRTTLMNVKASPRPTMPRPRTASGREVATANSASPRAMHSSATPSIRRGPNRSAMMPLGICMTRYTPSCRIAKVDSAVAPTPKRCWAARAATPRLVRWKKATR
ncbi:hypothetical protein GCM10023191_051110 [Actinoallomurus oryzae]|uniref:Uncharacterized protein n=1 Tax=Actinoallomurus oryzae TaxID=502180 RepID=A0ABP8QD97_9ACTN